MVRRLSLLLALALVASCRKHREPEPFRPVPAPRQVRQHEVIEFRFAAPPQDARLEARFLSPERKSLVVRGFYYGQDIWMVRFRPDVAGAWSYSISLPGRQLRDAFEVTPSNTAGPVAPDPHNPFAWRFANGAPYFPAGIQECVFETSFPVDGPANRNEKAKKLPFDDYFTLFGDAGFNLFRFSQRNCSFRIYETLDHYNERESLITDQLLASARSHGFRLMYGIFGYHAIDTQNFRDKVITKLTRWFNPREAVEDPDNTHWVELEQRFIDYSIARWGVYADFWELLNERRAHDRWVSLMAGYIHANDPYNHPVTTSWEKPHLPEIDINAPHWYESEKEQDSDLRVHQLAEKWKSFRKPVLVGEQGNIGMNWDPGSAQRMRIRLWTALFEQIGLVFWNTSWSKFGMGGGVYTPGLAANIYLGPEERAYVRVWKEFREQLPAGVEPEPAEVSPPGQIRVYALAGKGTTAAYLHRYGGSPEGSEATLTLWTPGGIGVWMEPKTGKMHSQLTLTEGRNHLKIPPFPLDFALLVSPQRVASFGRDSHFSGPLPNPHPLGPISISP